MWRTVTEGEFFKAVGQVNCHPSIVGSYPYTSEFKTPGGAIVGKIVDHDNDKSEYLLPG